MGTFWSVYIGSTTFTSGGVYIGSILEISKASV
jgi:hypothetical protein